MNFREDTDWSKYGLELLKQKSAGKSGRAPVWNCRCLLCNNQILLDTRQLRAYITYKKKGCGCANKEHKDKQILINVSDQFRERIDTEARNLDLNRSEFVRLALLRELERIEDRRNLLLYIASTRTSEVPDQS